MGCNVRNSRDHQLEQLALVRATSSILSARQHKPAGEGLYRGADNDGARQQQQQQWQLIRPTRLPTSRGGGGGTCFTPALHRTIVQSRTAHRVLARTAASLVRSVQWLEVRRRHIVLQQYLQEGGGEKVYRGSWMSNRKQLLVDLAEAIRRMYDILVHKNTLYLYLQ